MKIGLVIPYLRDRAGGEHETLWVAIGLQNAGHDVRIYTYISNPEKCFPKLCKKVKIVSVVGLNSAHEKLIHSQKRAWMRLVSDFRPYYEWHMMRQLSKIIDSDREVICATNQPAEWAASSAAKRLGIPWCWLCNEPPFYFDERIPKSAIRRLVQWPIYQAYDRRAVRGVSTVFSLSDIAKPFIDKLYGVDSITAHLPVMPGSQIYLKHEPRGKRVKALFVASFSVYKRPIDAIEAMQHVPDAELDMIGEGYLQPRMESLIKKLGLEGRVRLSPRVSEEKLAEFYSKADVFICTADQSWGLVAIDAIERDVIVISGKETGVSEILEDGKTGLIVPARDPGAIAGKIKWVAAHPEESAQIARQAKEVLKELTLEKYVAQLEKGFRQALDGHETK